MPRPTVRYVLPPGHRWELQPIAYGCRLAACKDPFVDCFWDFEVLTGEADAVWDVSRPSPRARSSGGLRRLRRRHRYVGAGARLSREMASEALKTFEADPSAVEPEGWVRCFHGSMRTRPRGFASAEHRDRMDWIVLLQRVRVVEVPSADLNRYVAQTWDGGFEICRSPTLRPCQVHLDTYAAALLYVAGVRRDTHPEEVREILDLARTTEFAEQWPAAAAALCGARLSDHFQKLLDEAYPEWQQMAAAATPNTALLAVSVDSPAWREALTPLVSESMQRELEEEARRARTTCLFTAAVPLDGLATALRPQCPSWPFDPAPHGRLRTLLVSRDMTVWAQLAIDSGHPIRLTAEERRRLGVHPAAAVNVEVSGIRDDAVLLHVTNKRGQSCGLLRRARPPRIK